VHTPVAQSRAFSPDLGRGETDVLRLALESLAGDITRILDGWKVREAA
jgi:hypothetical protein